MDAAVAIICFDLCSQKSWKDLIFWYNEVKRNAPNALIVVAGLKSDEVEGTVVKIEEVQDQVKDWGVELKITSAKTGTNVEELFEFIC